MVMMVMTLSPLCEKYSDAAYDVPLERRKNHFPGLVTPRVKSDRVGRPGSRNVLAVDC